MFSKIGDEWRCAVSLWRVFDFTVPDDIQNNVVDHAVAVVNRRVGQRGRRDLGQKLLAELEKKSLNFLLGKFWRPTLTGAAENLPVAWSKTYPPRLFFLRPTSTARQPATARSASPTTRSAELE